MTTERGGNNCPSSTLWRPPYSSGHSVPSTLNTPVQEPTLRDLVTVLRFGLTGHAGVTEEVRALCVFALVCFAISLVLRIVRRGRRKWRASHSLLRPPS